MEYYNPYLEYLHVARIPEDWEEVAVKRGYIEPLGQNLTFEPTELVFQHGQPSVFWEREGGTPFRGQEAAKKRLDYKIRALTEGGRFKCLLTGSAGTGKTTLAWILVDRIMRQRPVRGDFYEILPNQIEGKAELDAFMRQLQAYDVVFIDEVHVLKQAVGVEPLYHTLADTGLPRYPLGHGEGWLEVPRTVSWIAATTEPGELDDTTGGALRRRLEPEIRLQPPSENELAQILTDQSMPISEKTAMEIARRSGGLPWQALAIYREAQDVARVQKSAIIDAEVAEETFQIMQLDSLGLLPMDRQVILALLQSPHTLANGTVRYKLSETALCGVAGVDPHTYKQMVQPKLVRMGYLTTVGGQVLTAKAINELSERLL
jgi:Holliday junction DNA helicase RuvB